MTHKLVIVKKRDPERDPRVTFFLLFFRSLRLCSAQRILKSDWVNLTFAALRLTFIRGHEGSCRSRDYRVTLRSRSTFQNLESTMWLAKRGKGMLSSVEQAFVGREEIQAPLKTPVWEATREYHVHNNLISCTGLIWIPTCSWYIYMKMQLPMWPPNCETTELMRALYWPLFY